jgi:hypothetical protein
VLGVRGLPPIDDRVVNGRVRRSSPQDDVLTLASNMSAAWRLQPHEASTLRACAWDLLELVRLRGRLPVSFQGEVFKSGFRLQLLVTSSASDDDTDVLPSGEHEGLVDRPSARWGVQRHPHSDTFWLEWDRDGSAGEAG